MQAEHTKRCPQCGESKCLEDYGRSPYCRPCWSAYQRARRAANPDAAREAERRWRQANPDTHARKARRFRKDNPVSVDTTKLGTRARSFGAFDEVVERAKVYERDGGRCGICREPMTLDESTIDHIVPFSRGGRHEYANVQLAHRVCNSRKHAKLPEEMQS